MLLQVLQDAMLSENMFESLKQHTEGNDENQLLTMKRSKVADKIMYLLRNKSFIESSELAEYLNQTLIRNCADLSNDADTSSDEKNLHEPKTPREVKAMRDAQKVYQVSSKRNL